MITRPSVSELARSLIDNFNTHGEVIESMLTPAMAVLDRINGEWHSWVALLEADNDDIRAVLTSLDRTVPAPTFDRSLLLSRRSSEAVAALEQDNRELKDALVVVMDELDLPASADADKTTHEADQAILLLLRRMLYREDAAIAAPARSAPTSGNPLNAALPLDQLKQTLHAFLTNQMPSADNIQIENLVPLIGGASREAWVFDVRWQTQLEEHLEPCILMREPIASVLVSDSSSSHIDGTRRTVTSEIKVLKAMEAVGYPVPCVLWTDSEGKWLERPFSIARRLPGTADVSDLLEGGEAAGILNEFITLLARLHDLDLSTCGVDFLGTPSNDQATLAQVDQFEANYQAQRLEAFPATTYMIRWLRKNAPTAERVTVVHGDYRLGNFLHEAGKIVAILDWEQVHVGDPLEEIAFMYWQLWSLEPICPIDEFVIQYEAASGHTVNRDTLAYYRLFIEFKMLVVLFTGLKSYYATPERQLHYGSPQTTEMIRDSQLRAIEALCAGGPTVAFDAYRKS